MMIYSSVLFLLAFFAIEWVDAIPSFKTDSIHRRFASRNNPDVSMRFVKNSGVCETTPGVQQISGYLEVGTNMSMVSISFPLNMFGQSLIWASVVLVLWVTNFSGIGSFHSLVYPIVCFARTRIMIFARLNGGPGCSSMIGLFQGKRIWPKLCRLLTSFSENGPCLVNPDGKTTYINPFRWLDISLPVYLFIFNLWIVGTVSVIVRDPGILYGHATQDVNIVQVIYIDQPIGTGFSFGKNDTVNSTASAAPPIWEAFQILFESGQFSKYKSRKFV